MDPPRRAIGRPCARCGGSLLLAADRYGAYWSCLACGDELQVHTGGPLGYDEDHPRRSDPREPGRRRN